MDKLIIEGGVRLSGEVVLDGAKNAALPALAAALLPEKGQIVLNNIPPVVDIRTMCKLLQHMGAKLEMTDNTIHLEPTELSRMDAPYDLVRTMRASILALGPLIARYGYAKVSFPGGCAIGARPIHVHLAGLEAMGANISLQDGYIEAEAEKLKGTDIYLDVPTVTGTETLLMAATLAQGRTRLENAAQEPEIVDLANLLSAMGARIQGAGTERIEIEGVSSLKGATHQIITDRIETATYAAAAAVTGGEFLLKGACGEHLTSVIQKMKASGVTFRPHEHGLMVSAPDNLQGVDIKTAPYPGFPTDLQAQFMTMMCLAQGTSLIRETVFENRFMHVAELRRMGADIRIEGATALVRGVPFLKGAPVMATDLRASASLVLAALAAKGTSQISRIYHLDRGYRTIGKKLSGLGARVQRVKT